MFRVPACRCRHASKSALVSQNSFNQGLGLRIKQVRKDDDEEEGQSLHSKLLRYRYVRKIEAQNIVKAHLTVLPVAGFLLFQGSGAARAFHMLVRCCQAPPPPLEPLDSSYLKVPREVDKMAEP